MGAPYSSQVQDHNTWSNLCKNNFYPETIKNDNEGIAMRNVFLQHERNQQLHYIKRLQHSWTEDFLNCATMFLFLNIY